MLAPLGRWDEAIGRSEYMDIYSSPEVAGAEQ
jgi:hypothetical protein